MILIRYDCRASKLTGLESLSLARYGHAGGGSFRFRTSSFTSLVSWSFIVQARVSPAFASNYHKGVLDGAVILLPPASLVPVSQFYKAADVVVL
jgi:hypothetical protein